MEIKDQVRALRQSTGMNRKEFCAYFGIPYRTMTEWELGHRKLPDYVLRMMTYQVKKEKLDKPCEISERRRIS
jgi:putative transcriptional regulator